MKHFTLFILCWSSMISAVHATAQFRTGFELNGTNDFKFIEPNFESCLPISHAFTTWEITSEEAFSGKKSINLIPKGNPVTSIQKTNYCSSPTIAVSAAVLKESFSVEKKQSLQISFFYKSNSNPQKDAVHNCDSNFSLYIKKGNKPWEHISALCGHHKDENQNWTEVRYQVKSDRAQVFKVGFLYQLQNSVKPDPKAKFLIDDLYISVSPK